jgi:DICT domain-containing protein
MPEERLLTSPLPVEPERETIDVPLRVVPDWEEQLRAATRMARLIDRHLEYEAYSRSVVEAEQLTPRRLCPEQRVDLTTDILAVVSG